MMPYLHTRLQGRRRAGRRQDVTGRRPNPRGPERARLPLCSTKIDYSPATPYTFTLGRHTFTLRAMTPQTVGDYNDFYYVTLLY